MAKTNVKTAVPAPRTHEGAVAARINPEQQLRRSVMACMLFEDTFYESGEEIGKRIQSLVAQVKPEAVADIARRARWEMKLRHAPLLVVREMVRLPEHKKLVRELLPQVIGRADEMAEFLAIYWRDNGGKKTLAASVKKGLAAAMRRFDEHQLAKYDRDADVKLRDVLFLTHAKPVDATVRYTKNERAFGPEKTQTPPPTPGGELFKRIVDRTLATPDTWEVALSGGADKKETFERLMAEKNLGGLAFLRNLRNMKEAGVSTETVGMYGAMVDLSLVLPFRFIAAARAVPAWEHIIEKMMLRALKDVEKLPGKTAIVIDDSGSMHGAKVSAKSELDRGDAACALAILLREICDDCVVIAYGSSAEVLPARRGFALRDLIKVGRGGTDTGAAVRLAAAEGYDRIIVVTDEQSHTAVGAPNGKGYFINVATNQNGIGYGPWVHIDGWSEAIIDYMREHEKAEAQ